MGKKIFLIGGAVFLLIVVVSVIAILGGGKAPRKELTILSHQMTKEIMFGAQRIKGQAKNTGSQTLSQASVDVKFKDAQGVVLDTGSDSIGDLAPGELWNFEIWAPSNVASYEIAVGTLE